MKHLYLLVLILFTSSLSNAQDEQLTGQWFLDYHNVDDVITNNADFGINHPIIRFTDDPGTNGFQYDGYICNSFQGDYEVDDVTNLITFNSFSATLVLCEENNTDEFEEGFFFNILNPNTPLTLNYSISEIGNQTTLILTNTDNSNFAVFSRFIPPSDLINEWYLHDLTTAGVQHDNYIGEIRLNFMDSEFPDNSGHYTAEGGTPCEFYGSPYSITSDTSLSFYGIAESASCSGDVDASYTTKYIKVLSHNNSYSADLNYTIVEEGQESQLTLTNSFGDFAVYKTYPTTTTFFKTWYSYSTETANGIIYPSPNDTTTLTISKNYGFFFYEIGGSGGCNEFIAEHNIYESNENEFEIFLFDQTLVVCEDNVYEPTYFSVLSVEVNATFSYELLNNGETLVLTNSIGEILTFGSNPPPTELLGEWYLDYVEVDNVIHPNYYNNESLFELEFSQIPGNEPFYDFYGGSACESFGGTSIPNLNTITINELNFTLGGGCTINTPGAIFENLYFSIIDSGQAQPFDFPYTLVGENDDQILTITNSLTGDKAVYGKAPNTEILTRTWYLSRIEIPGNPIIEIPNTESPTLTLFNNMVNPITFRTTAFGEGECNAFMSDYEVTLNNGNSIQLLDFSPTLGFCESGYEDEYFSIIGDPTNNFSEFEITTNGTVLNITDLLGARLVFGDEPLSILENELSALHIHLKNNPVTSEINLSIIQSESNLNYQIFSIDGKLIKKAILNSESINVETLNSGLYFIRFSNEEHQIQTIKFIKE